MLKEALRIENGVRGMGENVNDEPAKIEALTEGAGGGSHIRFVEHPPSRARELSHDIVSGEAPALVAHTQELHSVNNLSGRSSIISAGFSCTGERSPNATQAGVAALEVPQVRFVSEAAVHMSGNGSPLNAHAASCRACSRRAFVHSYRFQRIDGRAHLPGARLGN